MSDVPHPNPETLAFDLNQALASIVSLRSFIPDDALTAPVLGTERAGHGVVIAPEGDILTIGYLVTEAETIWLVDDQGRTCPGYVMGYDQETGFGLVKPLQSMDWPRLEIGCSEALSVNDEVVVAGHGGLEHAVAARLIAKREFAGYWEYVLDEAIFTAPAHPNWGGAALLDSGGRLCGIGSLLVQTVGSGGETAGANMVVPIDLLKPILEDLKSYGRQNKPPRPWMGWLVQDLGEQLVVAGLYDDGPAETAGLAVGDVVVEVNGESLASLADLFRSVWRLGPAGVQVPLTVLRDNSTHHLTVETADRGAMMKGAAIH